VIADAQTCKGFGYVTFALCKSSSDDILCISVRDVTDSESASESNGIRQFFRNPKSDGYLKSDRDGFKISVSVQLKCYFRK